MTGRYCPECGTVHPPEVHYCDHCGTDLEIILPAEELVGANGGAPAGRPPVSMPVMPLQQGPASTPMPASPPPPYIDLTAPSFQTPAPSTWGGGPPPPQQGGTGRNLLAVWIIAGVAAIAVIALAVIFLTRGGGDDQAVQAPVPSTVETIDTTDQAAADTATESTPTESSATEAAAAVEPDDEGAKPSPTTPPAPRPSGTSVAASAAGIEFGWLSLTDAPAYTSFEWVTDDTGTITVQVPTSWTDRDLRPSDIDGVAMPSIWAAPDLAGMMERWDGSGLTFELWTGAPASGTMEGVLERISEAVDTDASCRETRTYPYDDGWYIGTAYLHARCGTTDSALLQVVAAEGVGRMMPLQVQMATTADVEAAVLAIQSFQAITQTAPVPAAPPAVAPAPVAPAPVAPAPAPAPAAPTTVFGLPTGLYCRDLDSRGYSYAEAVEYWWAEGSPNRMDADRNGIPCETVYPAWEVDDFWGVSVPAPAGGEWEAAMAAVENAMNACGYSLALDTFVDGPFEDGGYTVTTSVDVGWTLVDAQFEVFPWSGEVYGFDTDASDLLSCNW